MSKGHTKDTTWEGQETGTEGEHEQEGQPERDTGWGGDKGGGIEGTRQPADKHGYVPTDMPEAARNEGLRSGEYHGVWRG